MPGPESRTVFSLEGGPGTVLEDKLSVVNPGDRAHTVELRGTGSWITLAARRVRVPPRTRAEVPLTVTVPADAAPGDHPAAVLATGDGGQVRVPMAVRVSGAALPALTVGRVRVSGTGGGAVIRWELVNRGNTALAPHLTIRAEGLFGEVLQRTVRPAELPPGRRMRLAERWPDAPRLTDRVKVEVTASAPGLAPVSARGSYTPLPWLRPVAGGLAVLAVGMGGWVLVRVRWVGTGSAAPGAAPRRVVAPPEYAQYAGSAPPCDAPHQTPRNPHRPIGHALRRRRTRGGSGP